jgi:hypothetical protein
VTRSELYEFLRQEPPRRCQTTVNRLHHRPLWSELPSLRRSTSSSTPYRPRANTPTSAPTRASRWWSGTGAETVQYEGVADLPDGADLDACKSIYFEAWPDGPEREKWPDIAYVGSARAGFAYSDFGRTPARIEELNLHVERGTTGQP